MCSAPTTWLLPTPTCNIFEKTEPVLAHIHNLRVFLRGDQTFLTELIRLPKLSPYLRYMEWQQDVELALADIDALVNALQLVEHNHGSVEQQLYGQNDPHAAT